MLEKINCFQQVILQFDLSGFDGAWQDLWSKACLEQFKARPEGIYGFCFGQVFEPHVVEEVALLGGHDLAGVLQFEGVETDAARALRDLLNAREEMCVPDRVNLASALVSLSRFALAEQVLAEVEDVPVDNRDRFEIASLRFVIANRMGDAEKMTRCYDVIRASIETGGVPDSRILSAASSAVVWHMKMKFLSAEDFAWYESLGASLADRPDGVDQGALSGWYRGVAMVPAAVGNREQTRHYMQAAADTARQAMELRPTHYETNLIKTYHESSLKEHMYVTGDFEAAREAAQALIDLDPIWSVSRGEYGECLAFFRKYDEAAAVFEKAASLGPPYFGHHLFSAAQMHEKAGNPDRAIDIYEELLALDPTQASVVVAGTRLARKVNGRARQQFETALAALPELSARHAEYLLDAA